MGAARFGISMGTFLWWYHNFKLGITKANRGQRDVCRCARVIFEGCFCLTVWISWVRGVIGRQCKIRPKFRSLKWGEQVAPKMDLVNCPTLTEFALFGSSLIFDSVCWKLIFHRKHNADDGYITLIFIQNLLHKSLNGHNGSDKPQSWVEPLRWLIRVSLYEMTGTHNSLPLQDTVTIQRAELETVFQSELAWILFHKIQVCVVCLVCLHWKRNELHRSLYWKLPVRVHLSRNLSLHLW